MAKLIKFNNNEVRNYTFILSTRGMHHYGQIANIDYDSVTSKQNLNGANEISLTVYKELDGNTEQYWDQIIDLKLLYVYELDEYYQITVSFSDSQDQVKTLTCTSLCEAELSQTNLYEIEINTDKDIERDDYTLPTVFFRNLAGLDPNSDEYKEKKNASLLHRILDKAPHYTIGEVDETLWNLQRTFSIDGTSIYNFFTGDCAEQFNCIFMFDTKTRTINVYDLYTTCVDCGYRGEFNDICPECGSTNLTFFGEDTTIFVDNENLTEEVTFDTDVDSIKNCFRLEAGDDDMTAAVININPNGSQYIYYFSEEQKADMSEELVSKINSYDKKYNSYKDEYAGLMKDIYDCIDWIQYYTSGMMPGAKDPDHQDENDTDGTTAVEITAATEAAKLTKANLSPIALTRVTSYTSVATVNSALINYAKVFAKTGYVKIEIDTTVANTFTYKGKDSSGSAYGYWTGRFKVTNYSDKEDIAYSPTITNLIVHDNYEDFLNQKIKKQIASDNDKEGSIFDVFSNEDLSDFKRALTFYGLNRLKSFYDMCQTIIDILVEENIQPDDTSSSLYQEFYQPYRNKLTACQDEISVREASITEYEHILDLREERKEEIQADLDFIKYLGDDLYKEFCGYRREDTYSNNNFVSDGLSNTELFNNAKEFMETAQKEIVKSGEYQHSISTTLYNLLAMEEFKPLVDKFKLGNFIRVRVDDNIYRLRLISYEINFGSLQTINVEFSDITKTANGVNDIQNILSSAQSMATSYSTVSKQSEQGQGANAILSNFRKSGLDSAMYAIKSANNEQIVIDNHGITGKKWDDTLNEYSDEQIKITSNTIAFTRDNWNTLSTALGKQTYTDVNGNKVTGYGLNSDFVLAGYIQGSTIVGSTIRNGNGTFSVNANGHVEASDITINGGTITWSAISDAVGAQGYQTSEQVTTITGDMIKTAKISCDQLSGGTINGQKITGCTGNIGGWKLTTTDLYNDNGNSSAGIGKVGTTYAFWAGASYANRNNAPFRVGHDGNLYASNANITGTINATAGKIANFTINGGYLYNGIGIGADGSCGMSCGSSLSGSDDWMFWAGNGAFRVTKNGTLYTNDIAITGGDISLKGNSGGDTKFSIKTQNESSFLKLECSSGYLRFFNGGDTLSDAVITLYAGLGGSISTKWIKGQYIEAHKEFRAPLFWEYSSDGTMRGYAMMGDNTGHKYHCNWTGSELQFEVDTTWVWSSSDKRLKKNIQSVQDEYIEAIGSVDLVQYNLNRENYSDKELYFGAIAQDVVYQLEERGLSDDNIKLLSKQKVSENDEDVYYGMDYEQFLLLRIAHDEKRITKLEEQIEQLIKER